MQILSTTFLKNLFETQKETSLLGKWITFENIENLFSKHETVFEIKQLGFSEKQKFWLCCGTRSPKFPPPAGHFGRAKMGRGINKYKTNKK